MSFNEERENRGPACSADRDAAVAERQPFFVAPSLQSGLEGEATMVFLFPCSDYSLIRSNVSRFVESTFGLPGPGLGPPGELEALEDDPKKIEPG